MINLGKKIPILVTTVSRQALDLKSCQVTWCLTLFLTVIVFRMDLSRFAFEKTIAIKMEMLSLVANSIELDAENAPADLVLYLSHRLHKECTGRTLVDICYFEKESPYNYTHKV